MSGFRHRLPTFLSADPAHWNGRQRDQLFTFAAGNSKHAFSFFFLLKTPLSVSFARLQYQRILTKLSKNSLGFAKAKQFCWTVPAAAFSPSNICISKIFRAVWTILGQAVPKTHLCKAKPNHVLKTPFSPVGHRLSKSLVDPRLLHVRSQSSKVF